MKRQAAIAAIALVTGVVAGGVLAYSMNQEKADARSYCEVVEQGIEENMSDGFISCYPPGVLNVSLSEDVEDKSEVECVCRKKVGETVQTLKFATSN
jgi:hypothetical protein